MSIELALGHVMVRADTSNVTKDIEAAKPGILDSLSGLSNSISGIFGAIGIGLGFNSMLGMARQGIAEAQEANKAYAMMENQLKGVGNVANFTISQMEKLKGEFEAASSFDGSEIMTTMAGLVSYGLKTEEEFKQIMQASMDITAMWGGTLMGNMQGVAKAVQAPLKGIGRLGQQGFYMTKQQEELYKQLKKTGDEVKARALIWDVLAGQEGAAAAAAGGHAGVIKKLDKQYKDLLETLGKKLLPVQRAHTEATLNFKASLIPLISIGGQVYGMFLNLNNAMGGFPMLAAGVIAGINAIRLGMIGLRTQIAKTTIAFLASGWGAVIVAIGLVIAGIVQLVRWIGSMEGVSEAWGEGMTRVMDALSTMASALWKAFVQIANALNDAMGEIFGVKFDLTAFSEDVRQFTIDAIKWLADLFETGADYVTAFAELWREQWMAMGIAASMSIGAVNRLLETGNLVEFGRTIAGVAEGAKNANMDWGARVIGRIAELQRLRREKKVEEKSGVSDPETRPFKPVLDPGRYEFKNFGEKFQDKLLKKGEGDKVDKQIEIAKQGLTKQDELIKAVKETKPEPAMPEE